VYNLTKKELRILELLGNGMVELEIAETLGLTLDDYREAYQVLSDKIDWKEPQTLEGKTQALLFEKARAASLISALHASQTRLHALMELSGDGILIVDGRTGKILQANEQCEELFGYGHRELVGMDVEQLIDPDLKSKHIKLREGFLRSIRKREIGYHPPIFALRKDGSKVEMVIGLTSTANTDDVMVICTEYAKTIARQEPATT